MRRSRCTHCPSSPPSAYACAAHRRCTHRAEPLRKGAADACLVRRCSTRSHGERCRAHCTATLACKRMELQRRTAVERGKTDPVLACFEFVNRFAGKGSRFLHRPGRCKANPTYHTLIAWVQVSYGVLSPYHGSLGRHPRRIRVPSRPPTHAQPPSPRLAIVRAKSSPRRRACRGKRWPCVARSGARAACNQTGSRVLCAAREI